MAFEDRVKDAWPNQADQILGIIRDRIDPETFPSVRAWVAQCYHRPQVAELKIAALNELLEGYGVEGFCTDDSGRSGVSYVNFGDTYETTILLITDRYRGPRWRVSSWGDFVEAEGI